MNEQRKHNEWTREIRDRQRNFVFPDTARNIGGFWRGIYRQKLSVTGWIGLLILLAFYIDIFLGVVIQQYPRAPGSTWEKIVHGYGPYVLLALPLLLFFLIMGRVLGRQK